MQHRLLTTENSKTLEDISGEVKFYRCKQSQMETGQCAEPLSTKTIRHEGLIRDGRPNVRNLAGPEMGEHQRPFPRGKTSRLLNWFSGSIRSLRRSTKSVTRSAMAIGGQSSGRWSANSWSAATSSRASPGCAVPSVGRSFLCPSRLLMGTWTYVANRLYHCSL
jgi:hypothetical protein